MKILLTIFCIVCTSVIFGQNWIEKKSFITMTDNSDLIIVGVIKDIIDLEKAESGFKMPQKAARLEVRRYLKGKFNTDTNLVFYYKDIFNGCNYARVLVQNHVTDTILLFAKFKNDSIFQIGVFNQDVSVFAERIEYLNKIKKLDSNKEQELKKWIVNCVENKYTLEKISTILYYEDEYEKLFKYIKIEPKKLIFSIEQRDKLYTVLDGFDKYEYDNEGILKILEGSKDEYYIQILKKYLSNMKNEPSPEVEYLMSCCVIYYSNEELKEIFEKYKKTQGEVNKMYRKKKEFLEVFLEKL